LSYEYVKRDGTVIDVLLDCVVPEDQSLGEISIFEVKDITEQKGAGEALRHSE
jgi:hypothetical protein